MKEQTLTLTDALTRENAVVIVRMVEDKVGVCLSLENDGDAELFFSPKDFKDFLSILRTFETLA